MNSKDLKYLECILKDIALELPDTYGGMNAYRELVVFLDKHLRLKETEQLEDNIPSATNV